MMTFQPDLIIEVTGACNRACEGCYAPNVVSNKSAAEIYTTRPDLFLSTENLQRAFLKMEILPNIIAVRGGEPSLHPHLENLLVIAAGKSELVVLETHARWLLPESINDYKSLVQAIQNLGIIVKISFDKMHGLKKEDLHKITQFLDWNNISFKIAITESSTEDFLITRNLCSWISEDKIIFQAMAKNSEELVMPSIGVLTVTGELNKTVTSLLPDAAEVMGVV